MGFVSEHLFLEDAYPKPTGMQFYSERDFAVYWFFVRTSMLLVTCYLFVSYKFFGATFGQKLLNIRLFHHDGSALSIKNILLRIAITLVLVMLLMGPGPLVALLFIAIGTEYLNTAFSVLLLLAFTAFLFYRAFYRYQSGFTRSMKDRLSLTTMVDLDRKVVDQQ